MLLRLLNEIKNGGTTSPTALALKLDTSTAMIEAMLDTLESQGYLKSIDPGCNPEKPCESCSLSNLCSSRDLNQTRIRIFQE